MGLSPVSAVYMLAQELKWMVWSMQPDPAEMTVRAMLGRGVVARASSAHGTGAGSMFLSNGNSTVENVFYSTDAPAQIGCQHNINRSVCDMKGHSGVED